VLVNFVKVIVNQNICFRLLPICLSPPINEFLKSINICWSCEQEYAYWFPIFTHSECIYVSAHKERLVVENNLHR